MNRLYCVAQIRAIEHAALQNLPVGTLMQRAGQAAAKLALELIPLAYGTAKVLVLAGPGNNGGDALETALRLAHAGVQVSILQCGTGSSDEARAALARAQQRGLNFLDPALPLVNGDETTSCLSSTRWHLVVDGLFGIGLSRPISGSLRSLVETVNHLDCPVLALDIPSGLDADTGNVVSASQPARDGIAIRASHCLTFIGDKPGLHTGDGRDHAGTVVLDTLEIDRHLYPPCHTHLNNLHLFQRYLQPRAQNSHKGTYGNVAVIGGATGMAGAMILAGRAALHSGAGRVYAGFIDQAPAYDSLQPELMCRQAQDLPLQDKTLLLGPGLGDSANALQMLAQALRSEQALVLDADALNLIAKSPDLQHRLQQFPHACVLTPHPLEAARLLAGTTAQIQANRVLAAQQLAQKFACSVILKGSGTVLAGCDGATVINPTGNPALATAGTGDVLAGVCAALLAQGWPEWEAALAAVWIHGRAADMLVQQGIGPIGLTASELTGSIRATFNLLVNQYAGKRQEHQAGCSHTASCRSITSA